MMTRRAMMLGLSLALVFGLHSAAMAADKADANGTWKWKTQGRNGGEGREMTLKLKQDGEKLTGTLLGFNNRENEIKDGKVKGDEISFTVTVKGRNDQEMTTKYHGKVSGDEIKGKTEREVNGQSREREWEAKRGKDKDEKAA